MGQYCVNRRQQGRGDHEVHTLDVARQCLPMESNRIALGDHEDCHSDVNEAPHRYPKWAITGCHFCATECHISSPRPPHTTQGDHSDTGTTVITVATFNYCYCRARHPPHSRHIGYAELPHMGIRLPRTLECALGGKGFLGQVSMMNQEQSRAVTHDPIEWVVKNARSLSDTRLARLALSPHAEAVRAAASDELARRLRHSREAVAPILIQEPAAQTNRRQFARRRASTGGR